MFKWIKSYTHNRRAKVPIDNNRSKKIPLRHGVPQGGVLSPTLFIVFMNDLVKQLPTFVKSVMYADDLVMWSTEEYAATAEIRLKTAINVLSNWANEWCMKINLNKQQTADLETTHLQCRNKGNAQISPSEKASWHTFGCGRSGIKERVHRNYTSTPRLWINNMLISVEDIEL